MNSRHLQYAVQLAKVRSFSQLAEQLNISQPALSKQIQSLESELGLKLFDRNSIPLTLTPAGSFFIREAEALLYKEDQLLRTMERFKSGEEGQLVIGVSPFRNLCLMPDIVRQVKTRFPGVRVILHEASSSQLRKEAAEGKFDLAIINMPVDESIMDAVPIEPEVLVLAVPNALVGNLPAADSTSPPEIDFKDCKDLPFVVVSRSQEMRLIFDKLCASADFHPNITAEVEGGVTTAWAMARAGIGATLLPLQFARSQHFDENLTLYTFKNKDYSRQPAIVTRRGQYISESAKYTIKLLSEN